MAGKLLQGALVGTGAALIALLLWLSGILDLWEFASWRMRVQFFAKPSVATDKIKLILIDQNSLDWGEKEMALSWPWPREVYAPIVDFCVRGGARAVIFDMLFTEASAHGVADDRILGAAFSRTPASVIPLWLSRQTGDSTAWPENAPQRRSLEIVGLPEWIAREGPSAVMPKATFPVPEIAAGASILASVYGEPDLDGIFRRASLFKVFDGRVVPSLGPAAFIAGKARKGDLKGTADGARIEDGVLHLGETSVPIDDSGKMLLRFRGASSGGFETFSAAAVIQSELRLLAGEKPSIRNTEVFKDCYVFLGVSAPGLMDLRPTPIKEVCPGVAIHATVLDNLLVGDFLREAPPALTAAGTLLLSIIAAFLVLAGQKARHSIAAFAVMAPIPVAIGFAAYAAGLWWPIVVQEGGVGLGLVGAVVLNYATVGRRKALIKRAFKHYLSPAVIERILEDPSRLQLGGERRELTIFFSDLQGFSTISERLDSHTLTGLLNEYLSDMTDIILEEGGTLDKYEGDAIIAFWNAPIDQPDHAVRGCRAAIRCQARLGERREDFKLRTGAELYARIGMHTGEAHVGNMGSRKRFDYTVIGDAANLASRLEGANKAFGTMTMISETTWKQTSGAFVGRELGRLRVVGRKTPVTVYELVGFREDDAPPGLDEFGRALGLCYEGKWAEALEIFEKYPRDPAAKVYARRCRTLVAGSEGASWDGVWNLTEK